MTADPTYAFVPWLRSGVGLHVVGTTGVRATVDVGLSLVGDAIGGGTRHADVSRPVELYGPGDVVGIDRRAIIAFGIR